MEMMTDASDTDTFFSRNRHQLQADLPPKGIGSQIDLSGPPDAWLGVGLMMDETPGAERVPCTRAQEPEGRWAVPTIEWKGFASLDIVTST